VSTRYYLGGTTTLRGWGRYEVAPLSDSGEPLGGRSMLITSVEARYRIHGSFSGVLFADAGNVWDRSQDFHPGSLKVDVGPGIRWSSPVGIVRGDVGWQLTPIAGLVIDGVPSTRRWRIQISIGQAF
jgi:outer membrane translocation and assembly module TamA